VVRAAKVKAVQVQALVRDLEPDPGLERVANPVLQNKPAFG